MKKVLAMVLCIVMVAALMASCTSAPAPNTDPAAPTDGTTETAAPADASANGDASGEAGTTGSKDVKLALVLHALNSSFFAKIQEGAIQAGKDLGITVDVMAPPTPDNLTDQVNMIESCIAAGYDGIATVTWDPDGFNDVIKKAQDAGITVVGTNQDSPNCGREAFVGQDSEDAGYQLGKYMFEDVMKGEGKFIITTCAPTNTSLIDRTNGILRAKEEYPNIEYVDIIDIGSDLTEAVGVIENAYLAHPDVTAFIGVDVYSEAIGTFVESQGLQGKVYGGGFDLTEGTLAHIRNDAMQVTVGQNPFLQGYYPMVEMYLNKEYGSQLLDINTGAFMVTAENVDSVEPE